MKKNNWFKRFFAGLGIGAGAAIPGVSGAAIALIFRVYEDIINSVNNFRKEFKKSFGTLLPIVIGVFLSVVICVIAFKWAFEHVMFLLICIFAGFLIGSVPSVTNEIKFEPVKAKNIIIAICSGLIVIGLGVLSIILGNKGFSVSEYFTNLFTNWWMFILLFVVGILASVALTIPGFSGSLILLILGFYRPLLDNTINWAKELFTGDFSNTLQLVLMLLVFAIGCLIGIIFISKIMRILLDKHHVSTYYAITGFVFGSIPVLFLNYQIWQYYEVWAGKEVININPNLTMGTEIFLGLVILALCAFFSYMIVRMQRNLKSQEK